MAGLIAKGAERFGGIPVLGDCTATTREQIKAIEKARPDMLMGSAFRIWRITQEASFLCDLSKIGVRTIFITSEYLSAPMRKRLKEQWHAEVFHHYGMTEPGFVIGVECQAHNGFHFNETELFFEAVDPESGKVLESEEEGELVLSTLDREGMPLIRYRTGDVASIIRSPCQCGATTLVRIGSIPKRIALVTTIGDHEKIYTSLLDEVMYDFPGLVDYRVIISSKNGKDAFTCQVELLKKNEKTTEQVTRLLLAVPPIKKSIEAGLLLWPEIEIVDRGVLRRGGRTLKRRIKDTR
jgi:phenylacetate-coenzyme A ligase PaaK-like adenylate-forming protein